MVFIKKLFVVMLIGILVGVLAFSVADGFFDERGVILSDDVEDLSANFTDYRQNNTLFAQELNDDFNTEGGSDLSQIERFITVGYNTFTSLLGQVIGISSLLTGIAAMLGIPAYVAGVLYAIILLSLIITLALILMRLGVF
jgi:hypothetical protein